MMKHLIPVACFMLALASVTRADGVPPLPDNATSLRLPPTDAPHGPTTNGLTLALWTEKNEYELNTRMNVWIILSNTNRSSSGRIVPYDPAIHKDDYLIITDEDWKQTKIKGDHPCDGPVGLGFEGGVSSWLHVKVRRPGIYKMQWKIGAMESNVIEIKVTASRTKTEGKAQPVTPPYSEPAVRSPQW